MNDLETTSDVLQLLGEPSRLRLLSLLSAAELSVGELVAITGLTQSRVSTHLAKLRAGRLVDDRRVGTSAFYRLAERVPPAIDRIWRLLSAELSDGQLAEDRARAELAVAARGRGERWADQVAGTMERHYSPGRTWEATCRAFGAMLQLGDVLDIGSGDGALAELIAPGARSITCVDQSPHVVAAAADRLAGHAHVRVVCADMHALPVADASFDQVLMLNVLSYSEHPADAIAEAARALRAGGTLTVVTLAAHEHMDVAANYGHRTAGIAPATLRQQLQRVGLSVERCAITSREHKRPHFQVVTAVARRKATNNNPPAKSSAKKKKTGKPAGGRKA